MVVGVWELVLFLWSHPILSCFVLLLFSPPFFPIIVYFSPLLICTGLVIVAMVSMNMGQRAGREDWRNGTRRVHEPAVHVEMQVRPARESWFQWMKKKEEKAKAWVDSRFRNQGKWHFRDTSAPASEEEPSMVVDYNDSNESYRSSSYGELSQPTLVLRSKALRPLQINRDFPSSLAEVAKATTDMYFSVPESEDIKPIPRAQVPKEDSQFEFSSLEHRSLASLAVPLATVENGILELGVPSSQKEAVLLAGKVQKVVEKEIPSSPRAESPIEEGPVGDYKREPCSLTERATEVPSVSLQPEEVVPTVDSNENVCKAPDEEDGFLFRTHESIPTLKSITFEEASLFIPDSDQITKVEALLVRNSTVRGDSGMRLEAVQSDDGTKSIQTSAGLPGSCHTVEDVLVAPELSASGEDRNSSPEAETETRSISPSNQPKVIRPSEKFIATEKIIFVDEPSDFTTVHSRCMVAETEKLEKSTIDKPIGQIVSGGTQPYETSLLKDTSPKVGLDENIESCENVHPTTRSNCQPMALVSRSVLEESSLSGTSALVVQSIRYPDELELLAAYMEPVMSISNDSAITTSGSVLDKSYTLNSSFTGEDDDLTARFYALKKSMSFHTSRWEEPISLTIADANNAVVPVYIPDVVTRVERNSFSESAVVQEKKKSGLSSENIESVESITERLQKKFTPTLGNDTIVRPPPTRPAPALPAPALKPVVSPAPVESDKSAELTDSPVPPVDGAAVKNKLPATAENSHSKKSLTSFLSRRLEKLGSSNSGEGERGKKTSLEATDIVASAEISAEDRDESPSTSARLLREKMISPLKRVFSMDANAGSSRKGDTFKVSSVKCSPVREKQSVIDRSKTRVMKLFSSEGGPTKLELPEVGKLGALDTISLRKSKSFSKAIEQSTELGEGNALVRDGLSLPTTPKLAPLSEVHEIESVQVDSEHQKLDGSETTARPESAEDSTFPESGEPVNRILAETVGVENIRLEQLSLGPDDFTKVRGDKLTKGSSEKKFPWSWTKSEKQVLPGIAAATISQAAEQLDSKLVSPPSCCSEEGMPPATLDTRKLDDYASVRGDMVTKSSREKKLLWSWTKSEQQALLRSGAESLAEIPEEQESKLESESEEQPLQGIEVASPPESAELESKLEPVPPSSTEKILHTLDSGELHDSVEVRGSGVMKSSSEKKFAWSWTKKKRSSEPQNTHCDRFRSPDDGALLSGKECDEEVKVILMSPPPGFHPSSAMSAVNEFDISVPEEEDYSSEFKSVRPESNADLHDTQRTDAPHKKPASSWWAAKSDHPTPEKVGPPKEKKASTSWWPRRNTRGDSKTVPSSSDLAPADISSSNNNVVADGTAVSLEKSGPLSWSSRDSNGDEQFLERNAKWLQNDDDDMAAAPSRPRHRRERSDSLPVSRGKFSRLRGRQTSLSEIALPRTPELELSPATSYGRTADYNIEKGNSFSLPRSYEGHLHLNEDVKEKRKGDAFNGSNRRKLEWRSNSSPLTSYQIRPSSVRTLDFATEQLRSSPFHRTDLDVNSRLYRNSPSGAEIRITDKLKVPLEEVLSLLSTGDSDEQHHATTADNSKAGAVAGYLQKASSSSSEEEISSEEEWSATSDDEDESQQQQKQQQFSPLPPTGRIRRKLPHYIFSRGEATAS